MCGPGVCQRIQKRRGILTGRGRLIALAVAVGLVLGMAGPTSAQFFNFGGYQQRPQPQRGGGWFGNEQRGGGWFGNDPFAPYQQQRRSRRPHARQAPPAAREDFSKAPSPEKRNTVPERHVLVLGDSMADWLAYGLEDVYADQPEMGVIRKHKTRLRPDQVSAEGQSGRLGRRRQRHSRHRKSGRHRRHARAR